jgi:hypothetical protein
VALYWVVRRNDEPIVLPWLAGQPFVVALAYHTNKTSNTPSLLQFHLVVR